jgi:ribonuclease HI
MSKKKSKYYVVWKGTEPGIYDSWERCQQQVKGFYDAKYKSFESKEEAERAYANSWENYIRSNDGTGNNGRKNSTYKNLPETEQPVLESIAVDAACSGNPGKMEYRGVDVKTGMEIFRVGPLENGTNNIGEFLAIVHALALFKKTNPNIVIYSDSKTAIAWIKAKKARTKLLPNEKNIPIFNLIERAEKWLKNNSYENPILKWDTEKWGEIPADFGRK